MRHGRVEWKGAPSGRSLDTLSFSLGGREGCRGCESEIWGVVDSAGRVGSLSKPASGNSLCRLS